MRFPGACLLRLSGGIRDDCTAPEVSKRIMPVGTYVIATEPMERERADALIRGRPAASDTNFVLDYFRLSADHRLLFGSGDSYSARTPSNVAERIRRSMLGVFPQLAALRIVHAPALVLGMVYCRLRDRL